MTRERNTLSSSSNLDREMTAGKRLHVTMHDVRSPHVEESGTRFSFVRHHEKAIFSSVHDLERQMRLPLLHTDHPFVVRQAPCLLLDRK